MPVSTLRVVLVESRGGGNRRGPSQTHLDPANLTEPLIFLIGYFDDSGIFFKRMPIYE